MAFPGNETEGTVGFGVLSRLKGYLDRAEKRN